MKKKALLIGINKYKVPGADLRGCVNDISEMKAVLTDLCGFAAKDIKVLADFQATTKAIKSEIERLVKGAKRGDVLMLHYSGHGSNVPDNDGDEADRRDEILCPTDLDWKNPITDDWLRTTFDMLPSGTNLTVIMDCCHSGTNTRAIVPPDAPVKERYLPSPWDLIATESRRPLSGQVKGKRTKAFAKAKRKNDTVDVNMPEMLISGCRDNQTSADAYIDGSYHGALTYYLVKAIREKRGQVSYREVHARTIQLLKVGDYEQRPQLEGRGINFDGQFLSPMV
jgi:hypothetical protein